MKRSDLSVGQHVAVRTGSRNTAYMSAEREAHYTSEAIVLALDVAKRERWSYGGDKGRTYKADGKKFKVDAYHVPSQRPGSMVLVAIRSNHGKAFDSFDIVRLQDIKGEWTAWKDNNDAEQQQAKDWKEEARRERLANSLYTTTEYGITSTYEVVRYGGGISIRHTRAYNDDSTSTASFPVPAGAVDALIARLQALVAEGLDTEDDEDEED